MEIGKHDRDGDEKKEGTRWNDTGKRNGMKKKE